MARSAAPRWNLSDSLLKAAFAIIDRTAGTSIYVAIPRLCARIQTPNFHPYDGGAMIEKNISLPELILWTGTRVALGVRIGMLISRRLSKDAMKAAGLALTVVGVFTTVPLAISIMGKKDLTRPEIRSAA